MEDVTFRLEAFEGPLDLLLHLISKNKVSIDDIPIALILDQYLDYLDAMQSMNLEVTSDFVVMASQLILIKSKMLLPAPEAEKEEDPRIDLARQLAEYKLFKAAAAALRTRSEIIGETYVKSAEPLPGAPPYSFHHEPGELLSAYLEMVTRLQDQPAPVAPLIPEALNTLVRREPESLKHAAERVIKLLQKNGKTDLTALLALTGSRAAAVAAFLAILDMCRNREIYIDDEDRLEILSQEEQNQQTEVQG